MAATPPLATTSSSSPSSSCFKEQREHNSGLLRSSVGLICFPSPPPSSSCDFCVGLLRWCWCKMGGVGVGLQAEQQQWNASGKSSSRIPLRSKKTSPRFPDFKHKTAKKALWIDNQLNPPWVPIKVAAMQTCQEHEQSSAPAPGIRGRAAKIEQLWQEFFSDSSQFWDNRYVKNSPKYPDYTHKTTQQGLWIKDRLNPHWIRAKMHSMALGQMHSGISSISRVSEPLCHADDVRKFCEEGRLEEALHMLELMVQQNIMAPVNSFVGLLRLCAARKALEEGKRIHKLVIQSGLLSDIFIGNTLIHMYAKCGGVSDARNVFDTMPNRTVFSWTAIMSAYTEQGQGEEAISLFQKMQQTGIAPDKVAFVIVLRACARIGALEQGEQLHSDIISKGFESDEILGNALVDMYVKCGCIGKALEVFNKIGIRDVVSWSAMIRGYIQNGFSMKAFALYEQMKQEGVQPDNVTYSILLKACVNISSLEWGRRLHLDMIKGRLEPDVYLDNTLIDMYGKCGCVDNAFQVFSNMRARDVISWNSMIVAHAENGCGKDALALYEKMKQEGVPPSNVTYVILLKACTSMKALESGKLIHSDIVKNGLISDVAVANSLIDMYAKCGCLKCAHQIFTEVSKKDAITWGTLMAGYAQGGFGKEALALYEQMKREGMEPNDVTYVILLNVCASIGALEQGKQLHLDIIRNGFENDVSVGNTLIDMYAKCGCVEDASKVFEKMSKQNVISWNSMIAGYTKAGLIEDARELFDSMIKRDVVSWNVMVAGYAQHGLPKEAFALYEQMRQEGVQTDYVTFIVMLKASTSIRDLEKGKELYAHIIESGLETDMIVSSALIDMFAKCGCLSSAREVFSKMTARDVVSWNSIITAYVQNGLGNEVFDLYEQMRQEGVQPDNVTYVNLVKACTTIGALEQGKRLHSEIITRGLESDVVVANTIIDMYAKCSCIEQADQVFNRMSERDLISWSTMIAAYLQHGFCNEALSLYARMKKEGIKPDGGLYSLLLKACATMGALVQGKQLHSDITKSGIQLDMIVGSALVDMYAKCGSIEYAHELFNSIQERDVVSWNALIAGYAQQGLGNEALAVFRQMLRQDAMPNDATYVSVLTACSHCGLVEEGCELFDSMHKDHGIVPNMDHYVCMIDLLGRAGRLADAEELINKMPIHPDAIVWKALLGAAKTYGNVEVGSRAFDHVVKFEPENSSAYVLLSNMYAVAGRTDEVAKLREKLI